jgi:lipid-A-disaccharide synthase
MKYYVIAGEASGDLHARHLMDAIRKEDVDADIKYWYRPELAYMGFVSVAVHLGEILHGMNECKADIGRFNPDRLVLVDYPGFNLKIAKWFYETHVVGNAKAPKVIYYIPPKIWAWKEGRIKQMRKYIDVVLSILPFEVKWYRDKYAFPVEYVGNPTFDEINDFALKLTNADMTEWRKSLVLPDKKVVALMPGSRRQEIERNLPMMLHACRGVVGDYVYVIASAPNMDKGYYDAIIASAVGNTDEDFAKRVVLMPSQGSNSSFMLLRHAHAALVTSGTATLETAIIGVPQVVCYSMACGKLVSLLRRLFLKVPYVSLVNLITGHLLVPELVAGDMTLVSLENVLRSILEDEKFRQRQLDGYSYLRELLGNYGAPFKAAEKICAQ